MVPYESIPPAVGIGLGDCKRKIEFGNFEHIQRSECLALGRFQTFRFLAKILKSCRSAIKARFPKADVAGASFAATSPLSRPHLASCASLCTSRNSARGVCMREARGQGKGLFIFAYWSRFDLNIERLYLSIWFRNAITCI